MSKMPRPKRTTEFAETPVVVNKQQRQSRPSRIAQPTRGSYHSRSSSADQGLNTNAYLSVPQSVTKSRNRSSSASIGRTPQRTPQRNHSPSTYLSSARILMTAEKMRPPAMDKKWTQTQITRITEYFNRIGIFDNASGINLKTISTKQFILILNHFLSIYARKRFVVDPTNHVESITKILTQIEYPYTVNKSWLKTPTAPHVFNNILLLFSYFMDFVPTSENIQQFIQDHHICSDELPDIIFARKVMLKCEEGFDLWDSQKNTDFEMVQAEIIDELIFRKTSLANAKELDDDIVHLNDKLKKCIETVQQVENEDELSCLDKELTNVYKKIAATQKEIEENEKTIRILNDEIECEGRKINKAKTSIGKLKTTLEEQEISVQTRDKIIKEIFQLNLILKTQKNSNEELQKLEHSQQVELSRLLTRINEKISEFNKYSRNIVYKLQDHIENIDPERLCLQHNLTDKNLEKDMCSIIEFLRELKTMTVEEIENSSNKRNRYEKEINLINYEIDKYVKPKLEITHKTIAEAQLKIEQQEHKLIDIHNTNSQLSGNLNELNEKLMVIRNTIESNVKEMERIKNVNADFMNKAEEKINILLDFREREADRHLQAIKQLDIKLNEFNENVLKKTQIETNKCLEAMEKLDDYVEKFIAEYNVEKLSDT